MGYKIAEAAFLKKHYVTLISGPVKLNPPKVGKFISIETADELLRKLNQEITKADCLVMCAAVSDFKPAHLATKKIKRQKDVVLKLVPNKDILKALARFRKNRLFVGFSLETENLTKNSYNKLKSKDLDIIVANSLTKTHNPFGNNKLSVEIICKTGYSIYIKNKSKAYISKVLLDKIEALWYLKRKGKA